MGQVEGSSNADPFRSFDRTPTCDRHSASDAMLAWYQQQWPGVCLSVCVSHCKLLSCESKCCSSINTLRRQQRFMKRALRVTMRTYNNPRVDSTLRPQPRARPWSLAFSMPPLRVAHSWRTWPPCACTTSFVKPEVHNISQRRQRRTVPLCHS